MVYEVLISDAKVWAIPQRKDRLFCLKAWTIYGKLFPVIVFLAK